MDESGGNHRSVYGKSYLSPEAKAGLWKNVLERTEYIRSRHLAVKGDGSVYFPGVKRMTPEQLKQLKTSNFGTRTRKTMADIQDGIYDRLFHPKEGFDSKLHRDDRKHILEIGKAVTEEEIGRLWPAQTSTEYGRRVFAPLEPFDRKWVRINHVLNFYYKRGTCLPPIDS